MQIHKHPNETTEQHLARAFRWNKMCGEAFAARQARYSATPLPDAKRFEFYAADREPGVPNGCATRYEFTNLHAPCGPTIRNLIDSGYLVREPMSKQRQGWYVVGLAWALSLIAVAVFGLGN
jgi:hypothetical protein